MVLKLNPPNTDKVISITATSLKMSYNPATHYTFEIEHAPKEMTTKRMADLFDRSFDNGTIEVSEILNCVTGTKKFQIVYEGERNRMIHNFADEIEEVGWSELEGMKVILVSKTAINWKPVP